MVITKNLLKNISIIRQDFCLPEGKRLFVRKKKEIMRFLFLEVMGRG
jgi:hypothetical protein